MPTKDPAKQREYARRHYQRNREAMIARAREFTDRRRAEIAQHLRDLKTAAVCAECRVNHPWYVLQFDHVRGVKEFNVAAYTNFGSTSWERLNDELAKCDIVCANCHAARTYERRQTTVLGESGLVDDLPQSSTSPS